MNEFEKAVTADLDKPCICAILLSTLPKDTKNPEDLRILKVVGYRTSQKLAKEYCDRENEVFKPAKGGTNPYSWEVLKELM